MKKDVVVNGQSGKKASIKPCEGEVVITISGPKGSGKALVAKYLQQNLPLLPIDAARIRIETAQ
jgi:pantothenate kinase-related protein Tda10